MSRHSRKTIAFVGALLLLVAAGVAALYLGGRRELTTSSEAASRAYREAMESERRFYYKEARLGYARAVELDPDFAEALLGLARRSEREQAISLTERAKRLRDRLTERERLHVDLQAAALGSDREAALSIAREIHGKYPHDSRAAMVLAAQEFASGHPDRALQIFSDLLAIEPNNADAYNQIGYFYGYRGDYEKAIENLKKYQFMAPDQANPYDSLGEIQAYSGHYDEAIANLNRALALKPDFYESFGHLGVAYEGKGDYPRSIENYLKASHEALTDGQRAMFFGRALRVSLESGDREAAGRILSLAARLPRNRESEVRAMVFDAVHDLAENRPAEAERKLLQAKSRWTEIVQKEMKPPPAKPYLAEGNFLLALAKKAQGKNDEAIALYEEMINPPTPWAEFEGRRWVYEARVKLAELLARKGDLDRAESLIAQNRKWNPSWGPTREGELTVARLRREKILAASK